MVLISIVITVRNEADSISELLDSLLVQEKPFEIIIVDANSDDGTPEIVKRYAEKYGEIKLYIHGGSRGEGRNFGVKKSKGDVIAFTDGGCKADKNWLTELRKGIKEGYGVVAGETINKGPFREIKRVSVKYKDCEDITYPSCNLAYKKELFDRIGGFDTRFITAEDIDLNLRAVDIGAKILYNPNAIIYRRTAQNFVSLIKQSFWYGYGRKQLTLKHGRLWRSYSPQKMFQTQLSFSGILRLGFGLLGYLTCKITGGGIRK